MSVAKQLLALMGPYVGQKIKVIGSHGELLKTHGWYVTGTILKIKPKEILVEIKNRIDGRVIRQWLQESDITSHEWGRHECS